MVAAKIVAQASYARLLYTSRCLPVRCVRMARKDAGAEAPPPPSGFFQGLLDSLPAALMLLDTAGTIRYAAGQLDSLGDRRHTQLVGSNVGDLAATPEGRALVAELVTAAAARRHGEMVGPVRMPYLDTDGTGHITDVWVVNQLSAPGVGGLAAMLLPESAYDYFDEVLVSIVQNASLEETFAGLARALRHQPFEGECYFLRPATDDRGVKRFPDLGNAPGPPLPGPWDDIWAGAASAEHENLSRLSSVLREQAQALGYGSLACFAVHPGLEGRADACLVAWAREEGRLAPFARLAIERAVIIASLAMSHRSAGASSRRSKRSCERASSRPSCTSTSTGSKRSTTASVSWRGTPSSVSPPAGSLRSCGRRTSSPVSAATSSPCCATGHQLATRW